MYATLEIGQVAPSFAVTTIDGSRISSNDITGPLMLEVFATWCPHCQREAPIIEELQREIGDQLSIVAVSGSDVASDTTSPASLDDVREFAQRFKVNYPIAFDADLVVAQKYLQGGFPTIVFVNGDKRITAIEAGETSLQRLLEDARNAA
jgi:thiol-disulfide isomerase/thioredoxin